MLASAHYATRRGLTRPFARGTARHRRMGHKLSLGLTPGQVARLEGLQTAEVESLLADPDFAALIDGYRALLAMPEEEQRRILTSLARHLLMEATALGDVRVATYILLQERMGKDPARTLAEGVIAAAKEEPRPASPRSLPTPSAQPRPAHPSDDPDLRAMQRVEARLCGELAHEHAVVHAAVAADEDRAQDPSAATAESGNPDEEPDHPGPSAKPGGSEAARRPLLSEHQRRALALRRSDPPTPRARAP